MQKELIINDKKYADYEVEGEILFLKVYPPEHDFIDFGDDHNVGELENVVTEIIQLIENTKITSQGFLNV